MSGMITPDGTCTVCGKTNVAPNHPFELPQSVTAPTPSAVAQARKKYTATLPELDFAYRCLGPSEIAAAEENTECAWAEVLAAVRAECAAKGVTPQMLKAAEAAYWHTPEWVRRNRPGNQEITSELLTRVLTAALEAK